MAGRYSVSEDALIYLTISLSWDFEALLLFFSIIKLDFSVINNTASNSLARFPRRGTVAQGQRAWILSVKLGLRSHSFS